MDDKHMNKKSELLKRVLCISGLPLWKRITLIIMRILVLAGIITLLIMLLCWGIKDYRSYYTGFFLGMTTLFLVIPGLTLELFIRDLPSRGIRNISRWFRLALTPVVYGMIYFISPLLFHPFFYLFAPKNRTISDDAVGLQRGLWLTLLEPRLATPPEAPFAIYLLLTTILICYLTTSISWRRHSVAILLLVLLEAAVALLIANMPG